MTATVAEPDTVAEFLDSLGDVSPERVLWTPRPGTATEADLLRCLNSEPKRLVELIDGTLVEKAVGNEQSILAHWIGTCLNAFIVPRQLGYVAGADALMRLREGLVRMPDTYYKAWATLPYRNAHRKPIVDFAPDISVEVISPKNTRKGVAKKCRDYQAAGCLLVWVVDPKRETVAVHTATGVVTLTVADTLTGGDVLPGFTLPVADIFGYLEQPAG